MRVEQIGDATLYLGDCLDVLRTMPDASVDAIVTDPPYGLTTNKKGGSGQASEHKDAKSPFSKASNVNVGGFMGLKWDSDVPPHHVWAECLRVLKPGGHLLAFAGTRTQHRMAIRIEDAGFEIRDMIAWVYGSGFPKSRNLDGEWQGWGTALKPALEPITVARKPLVGTVAENVLAHGTGALNIDGCRVGRDAADVSGWSQSGSKASDNRSMSGGNYARDAKPDADGRWPANLIHDGSDEPCELLGDAARFFYCAKASKRDRDEGLEHLNLEGPGRTCYDPQYHEGGGKLPPRTGNFHPTVKPTDLMRYLCRLVTPPGGVVLDPFMGSGSTGKAAMREGFQFIGIEREAEYLEIAHARIAAAQEQSVHKTETHDDRQGVLL